MLYFTKVMFPIRVENVINTVFESYTMLFILYRPVINLSLSGKA